MKIILASKNQDKIREIGKILESSKRTLVTCNDIDIPEVEETGSTFVENAILKARSASLITGLAAIADDSGIEVDYLNASELSLHKASQGFQFPYQQLYILSLKEDSKMV